MLQNVPTAVGQCIPFVENYNNGHYSLLSWVCSGIACLGMDRMKTAVSDFNFAKDLYCDGRGESCRHGDLQEDFPLLKKYLAVRQELNDMPEKKRSTLSQKYYKRLLKAVPRLPMIHT